MDLPCRRDDRGRMRHSASRPDSRGTRLKAVALDLVREVLDHELVDVHGIPCGMVDDVELSAVPGKPLHVTALWCGPGVAQTRLPKWIARVAQWAFGSGRI